MPACFNPDHLADESAQVNNSRKGCPGPIYCSVHYHLVVDLCPHNPGCLRAPRDDVNCCLALKESDPRGWTSRATSMSGVLSQRLSQVLGRSSGQFSGSSDLAEAVRQGEI